MGTTPNIRVKGMSRIPYNFLWDPEIRHYAYEPEGQKQVDDIFRAQGKMYKHLYFSVWVGEEKECCASAKEEEPKAEEEEPKAEEKKPKAKGRKTAKKEAT